VKTVFNQQLKRQ